MSILKNMRVIEIPEFRAVSSGTKNLNEPSDFLWHENQNIETSVWALAVKDSVTAEDTYPYEIINFPCCHR